MKSLIACLTTIALIMLSSSAWSGSGTDSYWPLSPGDRKTFSYGSNQGMTLGVDAWGGSEYKVWFETEDDAGYEVHRASDTAVVLVQAAVEWGWSWITVDFDPEVFLLDDTMLQNGGSKIT